MQLTECVRMSDRYSPGLRVWNMQIQRVGMNAQLQYFRNTLSQMQEQIGVAQTSTLLATALCTIVIGSNDFINNYLLTDTNTKNEYDTRQYNILLLNTLNQQLTVKLSPN